MKPIISPLLSPIAKSSTRTTIATASIRFIINPLMALVTLSLCIDIASTSIPKGICPSSCSSLSITPSPRVTALPPAIVEIPIPIEGSPLNLKIFPGGSW